MLESIGAAVTSGIRLWKATAPTALHRDNMTERTERRSRIPPEIFIYSDSGTNILLDESRQDIPPRDILSGMESINTDDRVRNTLPDVEPIDID